MPRGRPIKSAIRQNIINILAYLGEGYGYDIYKVYIQVYPRASMRVIYYHLKKGVVLGEFRVKGIKVEEGDYSWGPKAEKVYYGLGPKALPQKEARIERALKNGKARAD